MVLADRLRRGERGLRGIFVGAPSVDLVEMAGLGGADFVVLDAEHGTVWPAVPELLRAAEAVRVPALVRVLKGRTDMIWQALDFGAEGVLVPGIRSVDEARSALRAARYAPEGERGLAFSTRAATYGYDAGPEFLKKANRQVTVLLQVETRQAVENLKDILKLPGLNGIFVGPTDLSVAYGEESRQTERVVSLIEGIRQEAEQAGIPWGLFAGTAENHRSWRKKGSWYCATGIANLFRPALEAWLEREPLS
ncbi:HpcH/HpaI aldolase family protein [Sulfobacillus harzensis]|uniref:HpcH/HpaI aldolase/citrate lyase domain-containing protein n=1 Tax=Sulfobacillus harzensis TaxID=2729629 RepID=A0A7Y0L291_9FIRM|nr:aldolase/citrate lyase family protein [Sulfobacillus harzensis]NMP21386.1 hypothetical protein [Sulfobacillus harzensis]